MPSEWLSPAVIFAISLQSTRGSASLKKKKRFPPRQLCWGLGPFSALLKGFLCDAFRNPKACMWGTGEMATLNGPQV